MRNLIINGELVLYGPVGGDYWEPSLGFADIDVLAALAGMSGDITVRLNSGGGDAFQGMAIYNALKAYAGNVRIIVDGTACSAASLILMAGDERIVRASALVMIHNASTFAAGESDDLQRAADMLAKIDQSAAAIYASVTGLGKEDVKSMMDAETWMDGTEALEKGFATANEITAKAADTPALAARFPYQIYAHAPAHLPRPALPGRKANPAAAAASLATRKDIKMPPEDVVDPHQVPAAPQAPVLAAGAIADIRRIATQAGLGDTFALDLVAKPGMTLDGARAAILDELAKRSNPDSNTINANASVTDDAADRFVRGAQAALEARAGMARRDGANEFNSATLKDLARMSLERRGIRIGGADIKEMVGMAFQSPVALGLRPRMDAGGLVTISDFAFILQNIASKSMLKGFEEAAETFDQWTSKGSVNDFKPTTRVDLGLFPSLQKVPEGAEFKYSGLNDRGVSVIIGTYGNRFAISRQAVINDDLGMLTRVPQKLGAAAKRTIGDTVYAVLTANPSFLGGPLFSAGNKNLLSGASSALSWTSVAAARAGMRLQKDPDNQRTLNITPKFLLVPAELETTAIKVVNSEIDPTEKQTGVPNPVRNFATIITESRLSDASATAWYLAADGSQFDTIEVTYLNGQEQPFLEVQNGWSVDGVENKVRIDVGVNILDSRTLYKSAGA